MSNKQSLLLIAITIMVGFESVQSVIDIPLLRCNEKAVKDRVDLLDPTFETESRFTHDTGLHVAAKFGDAQLANCIVYLGQDVNAKGEYGKTPMHSAATAGNMEIVQFLLDNGGEVDIADDIVADTPLHCCSFAGHIEIVKALIEHGADVNAMNRKRNTPLHRAAAAGNVQVAKILIDNGANVNMRGYLGRVPLHDVASSGSAELTTLLMENNADPAARDDYTRITPMHVAATFGYIDVIKVLLKYGADINIGNRYGDTPLHKSAEYSKPEVADFLLQQGALVDVEGRSERTPLLTAAAYGQSQVVQMLLNRGANIFASDSDHSTALVLAAHYGRGPVIRVILMTAGQSQFQQLLMMPNRFDNTPEREAQLNSRIDIARFLRDFPNADMSDLDERPEVHDVWFEQQES